ncbi:MAG: indole-3-glycerol phosphate synthase TrpC [Planctomycetota bacterium]|jgi:indole-3-glycerol phosphate synthase|nr:indole-3-glycerol phosphate synthase TrpC [Planctomycetota bacterium]MDP6956643.1 indole-3-glycerol phosphate synthase TrpC [Planctomycetota bacterium]
MKPGILRTGTRLDGILSSVAERLDERRTGLAAAELRALLSDCPRAEPGRFVQALGGTELAIIAECKRRSPSVGEIAEEQDMLARARGYAAAGAAAVSVLTEEDHFGGNLADFARVAEAGLPRLRKDFIIDEYMLHESAVAGADAVLLLAICLDDVLLRDLRQQAQELNLAVLLEVHDERELERALPLAPDCLGVNARDLCSFEVDLATVERLLPQVGDGCLKVAESGIQGWDELERVWRAGADAALCGTALMRAPERLAAWTERLAALARETEGGKR